MVDFKKSIPSSQQSQSSTLSAATAGRAAALTHEIREKRIKDEKFSKDSKEKAGKRIFRSTSPSMTLRTRNKTANFKNHFLITEDPEIIDYINVNFIETERHMLNSSIEEVDEATYTEAISLSPTPVIVEPIPGQDTLSAADKEDLVSAKSTDDKG